ncbi:hypothetical protein N9A94_04995 [Akkermansiaceae bacterium]|nr:hypothetical protein [Akkermansiaceae bacterium]MDB4537286.1 hypothetical protein [Akkermansiaceae bacterium]
MKHLIAPLAIALCSCERNCKYEMSQESLETLSEIELKFAPEIVEFEGFINYGTPIDMTTTTSDGEIVDIVITESRIEEPIFRLKQTKEDSVDTNKSSK